MSKQKILVVLPLLLAAALTSYALICRHEFQEIKIKNEQALSDYSMLPDSQKIVSKVELGYRRNNVFWGLNYQIKNAVLELICTNKSNIFLVMKDNITQLTINDDDASFSTSFRIENGQKKGKAEIEQVDFYSTSSRYIGAMVSSPLSEQENSNIIKALIESNSNSVGVGLSDRGYAFAKQASAYEVEQFVAQCSNNN